MRVQVASDFGEGGVVAADGIEGGHGGSGGGPAMVRRPSRIVEGPAARPLGADFAGFSAAAGRRLPGLCDDSARPA
jgi:hypothetical protein